MAAPDTAAILNETGVNTSDAFTSLYGELQGFKADSLRAQQVLRDILTPKVLAAAPTTNQNNLALAGSSVIHFNGASSVNLTGLVAPAPGKAQIVLIHVSGAGTITLKHLTTSVATNQLSLISGADTALATGKSAIFVYLTTLWRQVV